MTDAVERFAGLAQLYDSVRPRPPAELAEVLCALARVERPAVVDVGAGTGLSTELWSGRAMTVVAVEPSDDMRGTAERRLAALPDAHIFTVRRGTAEDTGLPDGSADIVTAGQAMHWFDPRRALPEVARVLRPGGVFAAYDVDWPPLIDWEVDHAYAEFDRLADELEVEMDTRPPHADKERHLARMAASGRFRHVTEIGLLHREEGDHERMIAVALSQGGTAELLRRGIAEDRIGLDVLREVARRRLPRPRPWWWTYRVRIAVR